MSDQYCWKCEYDWGVSSHSKTLRETVLCVLFDNEAQRQFSSVRITLLCSNKVTPEHLKGWHIIPQSSSLSVVNRVSSVARDTPVTQNAASLPICNIAFMADNHSDRSQVPFCIDNVCGELVFSEARSPPEGSSNTIFEFNQPLTENTQSVSVSFTSSDLLYTMMTHDIYFRPLTVGRIVRVSLVAPMSKRRTISLPSDVLLLIFENLRFPLTYRNWRKDILSSALVCREWMCALDMLLVDFRSKDSQRGGHPPEIVSFANGLVAHPNLGLGIKYLSVYYLEEHATWNPHLDIPTEHAPAGSRLQQDDLYQAQFGKAFLSILRVAKNVQTLCLDPGIRLVVSPDDLADAIHGLSKLEAFKATRPLSIRMSQLVPCIATWPSLKRIFVQDSDTLRLPPSNHIIPLTPPSCCLTELVLADVLIKDDELACIVSASGATLERLTLCRISELTNAGLAAVLDVVCTSLISLLIFCEALPRDQDEEHALDATITRMARLTSLCIDPCVASERMVERRTEAFLQRITPSTLPEVDLKVFFERGSQTCGLMRLVDRDWPGWNIITNNRL